MVKVMGAKDVPFVACYLNFDLTFPFPLFFFLLFSLPQVRGTPSCVVINTVSAELKLKINFTIRAAVTWGLAEEDTF